MHCLNRIKDIFSMLGAYILKYLYIEDKEDAPIFRFCSFTIKDSLSIAQRRIDACVTFFSVQNNFALNSVSCCCSQIN